MKKMYLTYPVSLVLFLLVSLVSLGQSLTNGLVSVWEFSESSGTVLTDLHGSNNGVNHNATVAQAGTINSSYLFHATEGDYIEVPHSSSLDASSAVSLSCWVKFEDTGTDQIAVAKPVSSSSHPSPYFAYCLMGWDYDASHVSPRFWISTENGSFSKQGDPIETGIWHHLAGVYDGSQITLYVDGASYALSATGILNTYATPLRMGTNGGFGEFLNGNLDQVAVWNRALSTAEIQELYNSGSGLAYALWNPQPLAGGDIAPDAVTIEAGSSPGVITSVADASGGISPISYSWEQSVDQGSSWSASVPPGSATSYTVPELSQTTWYRRVATSGTETAYSDLSKITVNTTGSTVVSGPLGTIAVSTHDLTVNWEESFTDGNYFLYLRAWTEETLPDGKSVQVQNGIYNFSKSASGFSMSLRNASGYLTYYAVDQAALNLEHVVLFTDTLTKIATKADLQDYWDKTALTGADTTRWGQGRVSSVNGLTGAVQLNTDAIDDNSTSNKFTSQAAIDRLATTSGTNTGDQDTTSIPGLLEFVNKHSTSELTGNEAVFDGWDRNALDDFDGDYNSLVNKPLIPVDTDDQSASEVPVTDAGGYYTSSHTEGALQELGDSITSLRSDLNTASAGGLSYSDFSVTSPLTYDGAGGFGIQSNYFAPYNHSHSYDNYYDWDLYVEGAFKDGITSGENVDFRGTGGIAISYSGDILTFDGSGIGDGNYYPTSLTLSGTSLIMGRSGLSNLTINLSSRLLALTGGTLTGSLNGTSASFSSTVTASNFILSSDIRLKKQIKPVTRKLAEIELKQFVFKNDSTERTRYGVIAQDLEKVAPEMVYEDEAGYKKVAYIDFLIARLAELEAKVTQLESQIKVMTDEK